MSMKLRDNPYFVPDGAWERGRLGTDLYQVRRHCPYCGAYQRHEMCRIEGAWFLLRCMACHDKFKVRVRVEERRRRDAREHREAAN